MLILFKFIPKDLLVDNNSSINTVIMNFLSIDCSTEIGSLFVKFKNKTFSKILQSDKFISDLMAIYILDFIKENRLKFEDLNHEELEFLHLQGLLNKELIKPLYLS